MALAMRKDFVKFTIRRSVWVIPVVFLTTGIIFSLVHIMPGSPVTAMLPPDAQTERNIAVLTQQWKLDRPIYVQYGSWLWGMLQGNFQESFSLGRPVADILVEGMERTFLLGLLAVIIGTIVAVPLGVLGAVYKDTTTDDLTRFVSVSGISIPEFWLALLVIMFFAKFWNIWFGYPLIPATGYASPIEDGVGMWFRHTIGPACVLAVPYAATIARITRAEMADVMNSEYITAARARGARENAIIWGHALRNALIPVFTVGAYQAGVILNGSVLTETVFAYPGLGYYIYKAATVQDYPLLMGATVVVVLVFIVLNLIADIGYAWVDPRIDYEEASE